MTEAQLRMRRTMITGSSDVYLIMEPHLTADKRDPSVTRSLWDVWASKMGMNPPGPKGQHIEHGHGLESYILSYYERSLKPGLRVAPSNVVLRHPKQTWRGGSLDGAVVKRSSGITRIERYNEAIRAVGLVDSKNVAGWKRKDWGAAGSDDVPTRIFFQGVWYNDVFDAPWFDVPAFFGGNAQETFRVDRNPALEEIVTETARKFWVDHVLKRVPPPIDGSDGASWTLARSMMDFRADVRTATPQETGWLLEMRKLHQVGAAAQGDLALVTNRLKGNMEKVKTIRAPWKGGPKFTFSRRSGTSTQDRDGIIDELVEMLKCYAPPLAVERALMRKIERFTTEGAAYRSPKFTPGKLKGER